MTTKKRWAAYPFIEVSMACSDVSAQERFWVDIFDAEILFRGRMLGHPFVRMSVCGVTLVFRENPEHQPPPGPGEELLFREHLGFRVADLEAAIADLEARGAHFVLTPAKVKELQKAPMGGGGGGKYLETDYIAPPLTRERIEAGEFGIDIAILVAPDNIWVELNEIREPADTGWFPAADVRPIEG